MFFCYFCLWCHWDCVFFFSFSLCASFYPTFVCGVIETVSHFIYFSNGWSRCRDWARVGHLSCLLYKCCSLVSIAFNNAWWGHWPGSFSSSLTMILMDVSSYCRSASCSMDKLLHEGLEYFVPIVYMISISCQRRVIYWLLGCRLCYLVVCFVFSVSCSQNLYLLISKRPLVALLLILLGHIKDTCMVLYLLPDFRLFVLNNKVRAGGTMLCWATKYQTTTLTNLMQLNFSLIYLRGVCSIRRHGTFSIAVVR